MLHRASLNGADWEGGRTCAYRPPLIAVMGTTDFGDRGARSSRQSVQKSTATSSGEDQHELNVHQRSYERLGFERPDDLVAVPVLSS
jgi:hypothetical protein